MDLLHPAVVHFPIALLGLYTLFETVSLLGILRKNLHTTKVILVVSGTFWTQIARMAGEHDEEFFVQKSKILDLHENLSSYVLLLFGALSLSYLLTLIAGKKGKKPNRLFIFVASQYTRTCIALGGFAILLVTGALGGALVHGPTADPFIRFVTSILKLK